MEMHQIRYFLAVSRTLNFTRAAEECNVTQPSLTRAIQNLEAELGGELIRRERTLSHLTELGQRLLPLLEQSYESAQSAKSLARTLTSGEQSSLNVGVSRAVNLDHFSGLFGQLIKVFPGARLHLERSRDRDVAESLKKGESELAVACSLDSDWDRFDRWPLYTEPVDLVANREHRLAGRAAVEFAEIENEQFLIQDDIELPPGIAGFLDRIMRVPSATHIVTSDSDVIPLLRANLGLAFLPESVSVPEEIVRIPLACKCERTVATYGVAGRRRSPVAATLLNLLRATDWSRRAA